MFYISKHDYIQTIEQAATGRGPEGCSTTKLITSFELTNEFLVSCLQLQQLQNS